MLWYLSKSWATSQIPESGGGGGGGVGGGGVCVCVWGGGGGGHFADID